MTPISNFELERVKAAFSIFGGRFVPSGTIQIVTTAEPNDTIRIDGGTIELQKLPKAMMKRSLRPVAVDGWVVAKGVMVHGRDITEDDFEVETSEPMEFQLALRQAVLIWAEDMLRQSQEMVIEQ